MAKKEMENPQQEEVAQAVSAAGLWVEKNANLISWVVCAILVVVCGCIALNKYVIEPKGIEASDENAKAVNYFAAGDYQKALNGDENDCIGFAAVADKYGKYQAGKLAALYAGICEYQLGEYDEAANYLNDFDGDDLNITPAAKMLLGDTYVELGEYSKAIAAFKKAAADKNKLIAPMALKKAAIVYLEEGKKDEAKKLFEQIKNDYPQSTEAQDIDKYIYSE